MARALLNVPLLVLMEQTQELAVCLRNPAVAAAAAGANLDVNGLIADLEQASRDALRCGADVGVAKGHRDGVMVRRQDWRDEHARWVDLVGRLVDAAPPEAAEAAEVRRHLGYRTRRSFRAGREGLTLALAQLRLHRDALGIDGWAVDPIPAGDLLRVEADAIVAAQRDCERRLKERVKAARDQRAACQDLIRRLRTGWELVRLVTPFNLDLPLSALTTYHAER